MFVFGETPMPETLEDAHKLIEEVAKERDAQKEHARTWEQRAKDNKDAAPERDALKKRVEEMEAERESGKSDVEKQLEKLAADLEAEKSARTEAEKKAADESLSSLRLRIGTEKGLTKKQIAALRGEDEESITAEADEWLEDSPALPKTPGVPGQGAKGKPVEKDAFIAAIDAVLPDRETA